jgi:hypothetical protein
MSAENEKQTRLYTNVCKQGKAREIEYYYYYSINFKPCQLMDLSQEGFYQYHYHGAVMFFSSFVFQ